MKKKTQNKQNHGEQNKQNNEEARALALPPMSRGLWLFSMILVFGLGVALALVVARNPLGLSILPRTEEDSGASPTGAVTADEPDLLYQCPMHPEVIDSEPSDCPICGMKLTPMQRETAPAAEPGPTTGPGDEAGTEGVIRIDPVQIQNIGVVSEPARRGEIARTVRTVGILDFNADRITWINTKFSGWIEKVHVNYVGQDVRRDQPLFEIYSPELVTTQEEYLRALDYRASLEGSGRSEALRQAESLLRSTRDRLVYWDISEDQIRSLETRREVQRRLIVGSPVAGVVAGVMDQALEGMFVQAGMNLYKIADMSSLWVHADIYESDLPWVREDQPAAVSFRFDPDRVFRGRILFLYPEVSQETRTLKICVEVPNDRKRLRAGMYTDVVIHGPMLRDAVLIPDSAVLRSGERNLVFVDLGEGRFQPREIELGIRGEGHVVQALAGLDPGESVVTQGQFMLDSESRVQEAIAKFRERGASPAPNVHRHGE
jgi:Cu(I)/Ag(I) efflux system membrane fusion protein/cobalt-zinc-cadmium efflux system membrane fusion protein